MILPTSTVIHTKTIKPVPFPTFCCALNLLIDALTCLKIISSVLDLDLPSMCEKSNKVQWREDIWPEPQVLPLSFYSSTESRNKGTLTSKLEILAALERVFPPHFFTALWLAALCHVSSVKESQILLAWTLMVYESALIQLPLWPKSYVLIFFCPLKLLKVIG